MKTRARALQITLLLVYSFAFAAVTARADELVSLDDPAPTTNTTGAPSAPAAESLESLDGSSAVGGAETAIDLDTQETFNPYLFSRNPLWLLLPLLSLALLALHLLPVPNRKVMRKIDQAQRFFRGLSDKTSTAATAKTAPEEAKTRVFAPPPGKVFVPEGEE